MYRDIGDTYAGSWYIFYNIFLEKSRMLPKEFVFRRYIAERDGKRSR